MKIPTAKTIIINHFENMFRIQQKIAKRFIDWKYNLSYLPLAVKMISVIYYNVILIIFVWYNIKQLDFKSIFVVYYIRFTGV